MMTTQSGDFLRDRLESIRIAPGSAPPDGETLWKVFFPLDVYHEETAKQYDKYVAFVRQKAPGVTELATPRPLPVREFQRRLQGHEALVATLVTPLDLYVWAVTSSSVTLTRHPITEAEIADKVQRLRAGLLPGIGSLPEFDAAVAHELYRLIFEPSAAALRGVTGQRLVRERERVYVKIAAARQRERELASVGGPCRGTVDSRPRRDPAPLAARQLLDVDRGCLALEGHVGEGCPSGDHAGDISGSGESATVRGLNPSASDTISL